MGESILLVAGPTPLLGQLESRYECERPAVSSRGRQELPLICATIRLLFGASEKRNDLMGRRFGAGAVIASGRFEPIPPHDKGRSPQTCR